MLLKWCTQYVSKFGSSAVATGLVKVSFHSNPKERTIQECANYHTNVLISHASKMHSKSFNLGVSSMWTENFNMYKLESEEAVEPETKLSTFARSGKKQRSSRKTSTAASSTMLKPLTVWIPTVKIQEVGVSDHLTCLLRNLYVGQEATIRTRHGRMDWFQIGKGVRQGCLLSPCLFNLCAEYIIQNAGLDESQAGIKIAGRNTTTLDIQMITL